MNKYNIFCVPVRVYQHVYACMLAYVCMRERGGSARACV